MNEKKIDSTSDERVTNNIMRHEYKVLSENEKIDMRVIKDLGLAMIEGIDVIASHTADRKITRELAVAKTKVEEAVMWAVKHITR